MTLDAPQATPAAGDQTPVLSEYPGLMDFDPKTDGFGKSLKGGDRVGDILNSISFPPLELREDGPAGGEAKVASSGGDIAVGPVGPRARTSAAERRLSPLHSNQFDARSNQIFADNDLILPNGSLDNSRVLLLDDIKKRS